MQRFASLCPAALLVFCFSQCTGLSAAESNLSIPSLDEALHSTRDLWGLAAMQQPNGPSYEFFASLLPPLRYVNAGFRYYPIVLSAPGATHKIRFVSNGSAVNARAGLPTWRDYGTPVSFYIGDNEAFGQNIAALDGPVYESGYLPMVKLSYKSHGVTYSEEAFASVESELSTHGVLFARFSVTNKTAAPICAVVDSAAPLTRGEGMLLDSNQAVIVWFSPNWTWHPEIKTLMANLTGGKPAVLAVATIPLPLPTMQRRGPQTASSPSPPLEERAGERRRSALHEFDPQSLFKRYDEQRRACVRCWQTLLDSGAQIITPEPIVNNAWRALLVGQYIMMKGDAMNYSHGNAYERLYEAECGDALLSLALFGQIDTGAKCLPSLIDYTRDALKYHNAGFKLQTLSQFYWLSRDTNLLASLQPKWSAEIAMIADGREKQSGLFPREQYCGDIFTPVYSLNSAGAAWRGLRDFAAVLQQARIQGPASTAAGAQQTPGDLLHIAADLRRAIFAATEKSEFTNTQPPFIPVALFGEEKPYDSLTATMRGSYWDLMAPYMLGSGMFGPGSAREGAIIDYLQERGGVFMGMIRFDQHSGLFANEDGVDDLYSLRYAIKLLQLDEVDRALVSFYGKLAHGMTRDTFISAEGTGLRPIDDFGRPMYLPPNSAANAFFLWTLRYLLVQDWDMNDDGTPETLRLGYATPKHWLEDGKLVEVRNAPTCFGPVSFKIASKLKSGKVLADLQLPIRNLAQHTLLRIRLPDGWRIISAHHKNEAFSVDHRGTVDISGFTGKCSLIFSVAADPAKR